MTPLIPVDGNSRELETLADKLRIAIVRIRFARNPMLNTEQYTPLPWEQLAESERIQWRDHARACMEVMR